MKALIFDSGTLINLSMNGMLYILEDLKKQFNGKFIITSQVKYEVIERPIGIKRFELGAMRIKELYDKKILESPEALKISKEKLDEHIKELLNIANNAVLIKNNKTIKIISDAETSCLALSKILTEKNIPNIISVDERTIRILSEKPENLEKIMERKLHHKVKISKNSLKIFENFRFIRSSELVYVAYKKGFLRVKDPKVLEAALYATKFKGAAISFDEIEILKKM